MDRYTDCTDLDAQLSRLEDELAVVTGLIQKWVKENAQTAQDTEAFNARCLEYDDRYRELQSKVEAIEEEKRVRQGRVKRFEVFMRALRKQHGELTQFDDDTWLAVIETVLVRPDGKLVFRFANGTELEI
jgi:chromosome segregation ATPase